MGVSGAVEGHKEVSGGVVGGPRAQTATGRGGPNPSASEGGQGGEGRLKSAKTAGAAGVKHECKTEVPVESVRSKVTGSKDGIDYWCGVWCCRRKPVGPGSEADAAEPGRGKEPNVSENQPAESGQW